MLDKIAKLIEVKSLITFGITGTVIYLAVKGSIEPKDVMMLAGMVFTYFFNKDKNKTPS
jgi:hypothetical protein